MKIISTTFAVFFLISCRTASKDCAITAGDLYKKIRNQVFALDQNSRVLKDKAVDSMKGGNIHFLRMTI